MISITIIEDNFLFKETLKRYIESYDFFQVMNDFGSYEELEGELTADKLPDIILMDIELPGVNGIEATKLIKAKFPQISIIMVTVFENSEKLFPALKAGAYGYLTKDITKNQLENALNLLKNGGSPMSNQIARMVVNSFQINPINPLTKREQEILLLLSVGKTYSSISNELFIAKTTVRTHIRNIYEKLHVNSKEEAIKEANDKNLI